MSDRFKDKLRLQLQEEAQSVMPSPDSWGRVTRRIGRARIRRAWAVALSLGAILSISGIGIYALVQQRNRVEIRPAGTLPRDAPKSFVGIDAKNRIVVFSSEDASVIREIGRQQETKKPHNPFRGGVEISTDGRYVYFDEVFRYEATACQWRIKRLSLTGGTPETLAQDGFDPSVSPDGKSLAYISGAGLDCDGPESLVIRELSSGKERRWPLEPSRDSEGSSRAFSGVGWSPDSRYLLYGVISQEGNFTVLLDPAAESDLQSPKFVLPDQENCWSGLGWRRGGGVFMSGGSCRVEEERRPVKLVEYDPIEKRILTSVPEEIQKLGIRSDRTGKHLLLLNRSPADPIQAEVSRWHGEQVISIKKIALLNATWW